ncbi:MAG TPA: YjgN family protein [Magnetospirillum sp.]|nr:YjgN family protein [Magnetospirillum sp.]
MYDDTRAATAPFSHVGGTGAVIRLSLVNLLLNIVTLSLWRFWGKTRVRRLLWSGTVAWGDPAEYTGKGGELFIGFLLALFLVFLPLVIAMAALQAQVQSGQMWAGPGIFIVQVLFVVLAGAGLYRARRYQLSRTLWRGIRGGQQGSALRYGALMLWVGVASLFTLGWAWPWGEMKLARYRMDNTTFGDSRFSCEAKAKPLYRRFALLWLSGIVFFAGIVAAGVAISQRLNKPEDSVGVIALAYVALILWGLLTVAVPYAWYRAGFYRQLADHTRYCGAAFTLEATAGSLIRLAFGNAVVAFLSLGVLRPWTALRTFRYVCQHLRVVGEPDWERVGQSTDKAPGVGEGLAAVFDGAGEF